MRLGIIGTAGRGEDAAKLTAAHFRMMCVVGQTVAETLGVDHLVSGGAAVADHVAVRLYLDRTLERLRLTLHLPCDFTPGDEEPAFVERPVQYDPGTTANRYHRKFSSTSLAEIREAINQGADVCVNPGGFKARNTDIANGCDVLLAFTFGGGAEPKDGGTFDTWRKFATRTADESRISGLNGGNGVRRDAFHFDLTTRRLYRTLCA